MKNKMKKEIKHAKWCVGWVQYDDGEINKCRGECGWKMIDIKKFKKTKEQKKLEKALEYDVNDKITFRDFLALPFAFLSFIFVILAIEIGGKYTARRIIEIYRGKKI
jgi:hypothetical protein